MKIVGKDPLPQSLFGCAVWQIPRGILRDESEHLDKNFPQGEHVIVYGTTREKKRFKRLVIRVFLTYVSVARRRIQHSVGVDR